jgi:hypothetical protein
MPLAYEEAQVAKQYWWLAFSGSTSIPRSTESFFLSGVNASPRMGEMALETSLRLFTLTFGSIVWLVFWEPK